MPSVALVHDEPSFTENAVSELERAGFDVVVFSDPMEAIARIEQERTFDTLITRVSFPEGKPNGVSLALVLRIKCPSLNVIFVARDEHEYYTAGVGVLIPHPVNFERLVEAIRAQPNSI